jgi:hypothetical protein
MSPSSTTTSPTVNTDPEVDALIRGYVRIALDQFALHLDGAVKRINNTVELDEEAVTLRLDRLPLCSAIFGSSSSVRIALKAWRVPASPAPTSRE